MAPCFADDGLLAGPSAEVLQCVVHWQGVLPQLGLRLSSAVVAPAIASAPIPWGPLSRRMATMRCCTSPLVPMPFALPTVESEPANKPLHTHLTLHCPVRTSLLSEVAGWELMCVEEGLAASAGSQRTARDAMP